MSTGFWPLQPKLQAMAVNSSSQGSDHELQHYEPGLHNSRHGSPHTRFGSDFHTMSEGHSS